MIDFTKSLAWNLQQIGDGPVCSIFYTKSHKGSYRINLKISLNADREGVYLTRSKTQNKTSFFTYMVPNKLSIRLTKIFCYFNDNKFQHYFKNLVDPMCTRGLTPRAKIRYLLSFNIYSIRRLEIFNNICALNSSLKKYPNEKL